MHTAPVTLSSLVNRRIIIFGFTLFLVGCSGMEKLETENASLKKQVTELEQVKKDYSDKLTASQQASEQEKARLREELQQMRAELNRKLEQLINENKALVQKIDDLTVVTIGEEALFGSGLADLTAAGASTIDKIAEALSDYPGYHIRVEGHTDDKPIGKTLKDKFMSNWELSTARATAVVRYMVYGLQIAPQRLSAAGYAQYRPAADNSSKEGRAANRRIRVVIFKELQ
jgi:chemotaxis protein MotB